MCNVMEGVLKCLATNHNCKHVLVRDAWNGKFRVCDLRKLSVLLL